MNIFLISKYLSTFSFFDKTHLVTQTLKVDREREKKKPWEIIWEQEIGQIFNSLSTL